MTAAVANLIDRFVGRRLGLRQRLRYETSERFNLATRAASQGKGLDVRAHRFGEVGALEGKGGNHMGLDGAFGIAF